MSIYQHFREDERPFIDSVLEWKEQVAIRHTNKTTDFLDPREQDILLALIGKQDEVRVSFFGGQDTCERKRAIIHPFYFSPTNEDFDITPLEITYPRKFNTIAHRDVLGALMSLGLKREKFGDVLIDDDHVQIVVAKEISDFVRFNLQSIGKSTVTLEALTFDQVIKPKEEWVESQGTVSSLRLDTVLSEIYNQSRSKISSWIESGAVKVNWKHVEKGSYELQAGDYLSLKGFGRSKLMKLDGETKKGKVRIIYGILQ